jgi:hypothetical protein
MPARWINKTLYCDNGVGPWPTQNMKKTCVQAILSKEQNYCRRDPQRRRRRFARLALFFALQAVFVFTCWVKVLPF